MPNQFPVSRYLLLGLAVLMLAAVLPDAETLWRSRRFVPLWTVDRAVVIDGVRFR